MYQGHHSDGSSVQKHSAGSHYPYVVGRSESQDRPWFVLTPEGEEAPFYTATAAFRFAQAAADIRAGRAK